MRAISIEKVRHGMVLGKSIYNANGSVLLSKGVIMTDNYVSRLKSLGIMSVYVGTDYCENIQFDDVISEQTRREALSITREALKSLKTTSKLNVRKVNDIIDRIIGEIAGNRNLLSCFVDIRAMNDYTFAHSVNVAVLSVMTGLQLGMPQQKLRQLGLGSLFHDVGKIAIDDLFKNMGQAEDKDELMKKHTDYGFDILCKAETMNLQVAHVAFQHHENYDGTGYPRGLAGEDISLPARIVSVVSSYDNLTSDTPDRPRFMPQYALEYLTVKSGTYYDPEVVKAFVNNIALFPLGTTVQLNSGERGIVIKSHKEFPTRPVVKIIKDHTGKPLNPPFDIDLMHNPTYFLEKVLDEDEF